MHDIVHELTIEAPPEAVFTAITTADGLASWWTTDTKGDPSPGGTLTFTFGSPERSASFEVLDVTPDLVSWRGTAGPDEWIGTTFAFHLGREDDETVLQFVNDGWREPVPFIGHCSTKWATFFVGLKALLEGGRSNVYPDEVVISSWDR